MSEVKETFEKIQARFEEDGTDLGDLTASYLFHLTGDDGGEWSISIEEGKGVVKEGSMESPACTVTMAAADFVGIVKGSANAQMLFMTGKLKVAGNMGLALKLQKVLGAGR